MLRWTKSKLPEQDAPSIAERTAPSSPQPRPRPVESTQAGDAGQQTPAAPVRPKNLAQLLLEQGKVSQEQLDRALAKQKETGAFLGEILIEENLIDENSFLSLLAKHCKIPHLSLLDYLIDPSILSLVPAEVCLKYRLLPIDKMGRNLTVAMVNPLNAQALQVVRELCPDLQVKPILCAYHHFEAVTQKCFGEKAESKRSEVSLASLGLKAAIAPAPGSELPSESALPETSAGTPEAKVIPKAPSPVETTAEDIPEALEMLPEAEAIDEDTIMDTVFGGFAVVEESASGAPQDDSQGTDADTMMQEMASVMMDSMRDTYEVLARRIDLFQGVGPEDIAKLFSRGISAEYQAGQIIFEKGQPGSELYVILGGEVAIHDGIRQLAVLSRGDMFGEMALVSNEPRSAFAHALTQASLLSLSWDVFHDVMPPEVSIRLLANILVTLSARLRQANELLRGTENNPQQI